VLRAKRAENFETSSSLKEIDFKGGKSEKLTHVAAIYQFSLKTGENPKINSVS